MAFTKDRDYEKIKTFQPSRKGITNNRGPDSENKRHKGDLTTFGRQSKELSIIHHGD